MSWGGGCWETSFQSTEVPRLRPKCGPLSPELELAVALSGYGGEYGDYGDYGGYGGYGGGYDEGQLRSGSESDVKHAQLSSTLPKSHRISSSCSRSSHFLGLHT